MQDHVTPGFDPSPTAIRIAVDLAFVAVMVSGACRGGAESAIPMDPRKDNWEAPLYRRRSPSRRNSSNNMPTRLHGEAQAGLDALPRANRALSGDQFDGAVGAGNGKDKRG